MTTSRRGSIAQVLAAARTRLERAGVPDFGIEAEQLLALALGIDRGRLLVKRRDVLDAGIAERYDGWIDRRAAREPQQHIAGVQEFHGLRFRVDRRVLIPRPETEGLVDAALGLGLPRGARAIDLGTGSGCIAVCLAVERPDMRIVALDRSAEALTVARDNVEAHGVTDRVDLVQGDMTAPQAAWAGRMDLVISNPPYVSEPDWSELEPEVRDHDPREALVAGPSGFEVFEAMIPEARALLKRGGYLLLELGYGQADGLRERAQRAGFADVEIRPDLRSIPRVLLATLGREPAV